MRIIPVIDLRQGLVVRGVAGRRSEYRSVQSRLTDDPRPAPVGRAFARLGFREVYVADLDAIGGAPPNWAAYAELLALGLELWIDAGIADTESATRIATFESHGRIVSRVVAGLESLPGPDCLPDLLDALGPDRLVFSLDLMHGEPIDPRGVWKGLNAGQIADSAVNCGVRRMIVLDLSCVGTGRLGTLDLCRSLRTSSPPELEIISGGGVHSRADLESLREAGCDAALVASALHDGTFGQPATGCSVPNRIALL